MSEGWIVAFFIGAVNLIGAVFLGIRHLRRISLHQTKVGFEQDRTTTADAIGAWRELYDRASDRLTVCEKESKRNVRWRYAMTAHIQYLERILHDQGAEFQAWTWEEPTEDEPSLFDGESGEVQIS